MITLFIYIGTRQLIDEYAGLVTFFICIALFTSYLQFDLLNAAFKVELLALSYDRAILYVIAILNTSIGFLIIHLIENSRLTLESWTKSVNIAFILLISFNLLQIGFSYSDNSSNINQLEINSGENPESEPNIYYIVTDKYASFNVLENQYNFSNRGIQDSLEEKNFSVVKDFQTNYEESWASLASSLNLRYLQELGIKEGTSQKQTYPLIYDHEVQSFLQERGYDYYHIGGAYTEFNKNADKSYFYFREYFGDKISLNRFEVEIIEKTIVHSNSNIKSSGYANIKNYETLSNISEKQGKKFVFAHIMSPHKPYRLPKTVEEVEYYKEWEASTRKRYIQEIKANNILLNKTISEVTSNDENAVIVIQGDEGPTWTNSNFSKHQDIKRTHSGFFAHRSPKIPDSDFEENISPVNVFRKIFNFHFNTNLSIKDNRIYTVQSGKELEFKKENISNTLRK